jgi:peroxiredoxin
VSEATDMSTGTDKFVAAAEERWKTGWATGPKRLRWTSLPLQAGDRAPDATLLDHNGQLVSLASLWRDKPLLLLFWRHFGCSCGSDRAARLNAEIDDYRAAGGNVVIIGQGEPERAAHYRNRQNLEVSILWDQHCATYELYGLLQGSPAQILFDAPDQFLRCDLQSGLDLAASRHGTDRALVDDPWQLPGEFVIDTNGILRFAHRYGWCEDYPDPRVHVAVIREAAGLL